MTQAERGSSIPPNVPEWTRTPLPDPEREALTLLFLESVRAFVTSLDQELTSVETRETRSMVGPHPVALIGFAGDRAAGVLALGTPWTFLRKTHPMGAAAAEDGLLDWSRELANLMLGGLKWAMLERGVRIDMGLPSTVLGEPVEVRSASSRGMTVIASITDSDPIELWLDVAMAPGVELRQGVTATSGPGDQLF